MRTASLASIALVLLCAQAAHAQPPGDAAEIEPPAEPPVEEAQAPAEPPADTAQPPAEPPVGAAPAQPGTDPYAQPQPATSPYAQPSGSPYPQPATSPYAQPYAPTTPVAQPVVEAQPAYQAQPAPSPAPRARDWWGAFEFRFGGSMGFAQLDTGVALQRHHGYGGFVGMEFAQPIARLGDVGHAFFALTWNAIDLRSSDPEGWVVGGTDAGAGAGARFDFDVDTYLQVWLGYLFAGDSQAVYPDAGDLIAMWHLAYARARFRLGILAVELGGGAGVGQHVLAGLRLQLADSLWLGVDVNGYFAGGEEHPSRFGRELWITRAFFAIRWE